MNKAVQKILIQNHVTQSAYKSKKLCSHFNVKDSTKLEPQYHLTLKDFKILTKSFNHCKFKRKVYEALIIKNHQPTLNAQKKSVTPELFNRNKLHLCFIPTVSF